MGKTSFTAAEIRHYYDRNTPLFVSRGQGGSLGAIHRAVWAPGVTTHEQAFRWVEDQIAAHVSSVQRADAAAHVVDLGCGVGGSLCYLATRAPIRGTGVTLSPLQAQIARERIAAAGLGDRVRCLEGDYCDLPPEVGAADAAYAIESFVHGPSPERFFAEAARIVRAGGLLIVCDDVRGDASGRKAEAAIEQFARGWHVNSLLTGEQMRVVAAAAGFSHESTMDLTPYLELGRPRDRVIAWVTRLFGWVPSTRLAPLVGGAALQTCLSRRWLRHELLVFRRNGSAPR